MIAFSSAVRAGLLLTSGRRAASFLITCLAKVTFCLSVARTPSTLTGASVACQQS
jgi:hypothetical protein